MEEQPPEKPQSDADKQRSQSRPLILRSEDLFENCREVWIEHGEVMYRLRLTASGKLYLTK